MTTVVLVLNTTYEPLSHTRLGRAIALVTAGHAVVEEVIPGRFLHFAGGQIPWPKVLRMLRYIKKPFTHQAATWSKRGVMKRDHYLCGYCGRTADTVDHVVPSSRGGGRRDWLNTVAACQPCNNRKGDRTLAKAGMTLQMTPFVPMSLGR